MGFVPRRYDPAIVEALAMAGVLAPELDRAGREAALARTAIWLDAGDRDAKWSAELTEEGAVMVKRIWRGVTDAYPIEASFLTSAEARKLARLAAENVEVYASPARLVRAGTVVEEVAEPEAEAEVNENDQVAPVTRTQSVKDQVTRPSELLDAVLAAGRKGLSIARYKGLGEMNAEQLWETTLDPDIRSLLQVKVEDADVTDEIFTRLMGDVVEPRRDFIQENALNVANLDV
mgnify:CR=1 FL=1